MDIQKQGIIDQVIESQKTGRKVNEVLSVMGIKSSTFYRWKKQLNNKDEKRVIHPSDRITTRSLTDEEVVLILKTVVARDITELYLDGLSEFNGMPADWPHKPELRVVQGSPNTSYVTKQFFKDIVADLSFARVHRPTDNARTERFYGTIK